MLISNPLRLVPRPRSRGNFLIVLEVVVVLDLPAVKKTSTKDDGLVLTP